MSTRDGLDHDWPPYVELTTNTSALVTGAATSWMPLRLSENVRNNAPVFGLATMLPAEFTRTWYPVSV